MIWLQQATGLAPATFALAALMTFGAAAIRGLTGFGMAIVLVPLLGLVIRPDDAVVLAILLQLLIGPVGISAMLRDGDKQSAAIIAAAAIFATPFGIWLLAHTEPDVARLSIAAIAIGAFLLVLLPVRTGYRPGPLAGIVTGLMAGALTGFAAMPGPPVVPYYLRQDIAPERARASMMLVFFATAMAGTASAGLLGMITPNLPWLAIVLFVPMALGNWLGGQAFGTVPARLWREIVAAILGIAGVSALSRALN